MAASYGCYVLTKEEANFNVLYQVSSSIQKNDFIPKENLFHKLSVHV